MHKLAHHIAVVSFALVSCVTAHAQVHITTARDAAKETLVRRQPNQIVDAYLGRITCEKKSFKLWQENIDLGLAAPLPVADIEKAFSSQIFYSLADKEETKGAEHIRFVYTQVSEVLSNLRTLAIFFGHDIHNFYSEENAKRTAANLEPLTKKEFLRQFASGQIVLKSGDINLKDYMQARINDIETGTAAVNYGCAGNRNFLHRQGSELSESLSASAFVIPATPSAIKLASTIDQKKAPTNPPERLPSSIGPTDDGGHTGAAAADAVAKEEKTLPTRWYYKFRNVHKVPAAALDEALAKFQETKRRGIQVNEERMVVVDYTKFSNEPRFWVLNLKTGNATAMMMGHGNGKGSLSDSKMSRDRVAFVSNAMGSNASSWGAMLLGGKHVSKANLKSARKLVGLEPQNSNVENRGLVLHEGSYNGNVYVDDEGAGRSEGCFALSPENARWVDQNLPPGTFLYAYKGNIPDVATRAQARQAMMRRP